MPRAVPALAAAYTLALSQGVRGKTGNAWAPGGSRPARVRPDVAGGEPCRRGNPGRAAVSGRPLGATVAEPGQARIEMRQREGHSRTPLDPSGPISNASAR